MPKLNRQEMVGAIAQSIVADFEFKANNLEPLTSEDMHGIFELAAEHIESDQRDLSSRIGREKRELDRGGRNCHLELPQEIRDMLADHRGEGRI